MRNDILTDIISHKFKDNPRFIKTTKIYNDDGIDYQTIAWTFPKRINSNPATIIPMPPKNQCGLCQMSFSSEFFLLKHFASHRKNAVAQYKCIFCPKIYYHPYNLRLHEKKNHNHCDICENLHKTRRGLVRHIKKVHEKQTNNTQSKSGTFKIGVYLVFILKIL